MCYCDSGKEFEHCCKPYLDGLIAAPGPLALMRSRYSAYATEHCQYVHDTYARERQGDNPLDEIADFARQCRFIRLEVLNYDERPDSGEVEFKAHYLLGDHYCTLHERSRFCLESGSWRYLDGELFPTRDVKLGRNDPCPCQSGKKFKQCHGR